VGVFTTSVYCYTTKVIKSSKLSLDKLKKRLKSFFIDPSAFVPLRVVQMGEQFHLVLKKKRARTKSSLATSTDGFSFEMAPKNIIAPPIEGFPKAAIVQDYVYNNKNVMYYGDRSISIAYSQDKTEWAPAARPILVSARPLEVGNVFTHPNGLLLVYFEKTIKKGITHYATHLAFFDKKNPEKLQWKTVKPIWSQASEWPDEMVTPIGAAFYKERLITYWSVEGRGIFGVILSGFQYDPNAFTKQKVKLNKHITNPILAPQAENDWEAFTTFNPAAVHVGNKVHILYRAQGFDYISSVGYAVSNDGISVDKRLKDPIYKPEQDFESNHTGSADPNLMSGGGYGGCEDPRVTLLGNRVYMTYVAFNGWTSIRLALTSISVEDFLNERWNWTKPVLLSRPGVIDKSGCLLPEKVRGKYVFFHRIFPNILIDYVDDLNFDEEHNWLKGEYSIKVRPDKWDSRKIGAGAPPIKTKDGWLLIYYGVDDRDASKYHIGAMLLDLKHPEKVLYRSDEPILRPSEEYENTGFKPGIAYPCGAVVKNNELLVYYGGADSVVCVATAHLDTFLSELKAHKPTHLHTISIREVTY
jgi:predicted GH43/DUF377 family glycosyl hydrolase